MKSMQEFLQMGGYAIYVWPAYAMAAVVMVANIVQPNRRLKRLLVELRQTTTRGRHP
jgi:heme exporter protein D